MHDEQCLAQPSDLRDQVLLRGIDQELPLDPERPSLEKHLGLALRFDLRNALAEEPGDVAGVARRGDRHYSLRLRDVAGGREDRRAAEAMADQYRGRAIPLP